MRIYLDNCALGRLFDNQDQSRLVEEAKAVEAILDLVARRTIEWSSSAALEQGLAQNTDVTRRMEVQALLRMANAFLDHTAATRERVSALQAAGLAPFDAQHVAFAEAAGADQLITTDDRLIRACARLASQGKRQKITPVDVINPVNWLRKVEL